ncbi:MAG: alpha/beta hydrolase [Candidatus Omnitrophica bacterium]|nr:alpha/beta hydrolase [Candidatus Omnitrophota bacterium]
MPKIKTDDMSLYYEVHGRGKPLLLVAGLGSDSSSWSGVIGEFSLHFRTIVFDNRDSGRSDITQKQFTIRDMAEDAIKLLNFLKIEQTHIVGHSMGGYIAQELAINYPERVDKLVLASTAPISSKRNNDLFEDIYKQLKREGISRAWLERWIPWLFSPRLINDRAFIDAFIKNSVGYPYSQKADGFERQIKAIAAFDARDKMVNIKAETLIFEGKDDRLVTPEEAETLAKGIYKSTFRLLDGVAHSIHMEDPKLFTDSVMAFLNNN